MNNSERKLSILYGSQTGNAEEVSERIWRESKRFYFTGCVKQMDDYDINNIINENCVIFVCSTTGQGEEPDNMKTFWKFLLRKNLPSNLFAHVRKTDSCIDGRCAVLGLGDSSYAKFNFVAKRLNKRLVQLGATMLLPLALGDDQHDLGYDAVVDLWLDSLWKKLLEIFPLDDNVQSLPSNTAITPRWKVIISETQRINTTKSKLLYFSDVRIPEHQFYVEVIENIRTTSSSHFQDVRLIKFATQGQHYEPGDVLYVRPHNSKEQIKDFFDVFSSNGVDFDPNMVLKLATIYPDMPVPKCLRKEVTLQQLCEEYFDLNAIPRRYVFNVLAQATTSELEREKCLEFITAEGQNDLFNYCNRPRRTIVEVLRDFPHAVEHLSLDQLFEILTPIKPRAFSIASSWKYHTKELHVLVAVVRYKTKLVKERLGLCSNWLAELPVGSRVPVWIKKGSFRFPEDERSAIIMVGPGTGVAPFRNYILEAEALNKTKSNKLILFFGCRNEKHDFHCYDDFLRLKNEEKLDLICAFSRDQGHKIYVQHKIEEHGEKLWRLLSNNNCFIFVAGSSKNMPQSVREAFVNVYRKYGGFREGEAENFVTLLEKSGRYQTETWS